MEKFNLMVKTTTTAHDQNKNNPFQGLEDENIFDFSTLGKDLGNEIGKIVGYFP